MRLVRLAVLALVVVVGGCSFFDRYPDDDLADARLAAIEADPGFTFVPPGAALDGVASVRRCADEGADWSGLSTQRNYDALTSMPLAYGALLTELEERGWVVTRHQVTDGEGPEAEASIHRSFDGWVADGQVQGFVADHRVEIAAGPDEAGVCSPT